MSPPAAKKWLLQQTGHLCWAMLAKCLIGGGDNVSCCYRLSHVAVQSASATCFTLMMLCWLMQMRSEAAAEKEMPVEVVI